MPVIAEFENVRLFVGTVGELAREVKNKPAWLLHYGMVGEVVDKSLALQVTLRNKRAINCYPIGPHKSAQHLEHNLGDNLMDLREMTDNIYYQVLTPGCALALSQQLEQWFGPLKEVSMSAQTLPVYTCHKEVRGAMIVTWNIDKNDVLVSLPDGDTRVVEVPEGWFAKHKPEQGNYLVVYEDGYISCSPAKAFEEGYSLKDPAS